MSIGLPPGQQVRNVILQAAFKFVSLVLRRRGEEGERGVIRKQKNTRGQVLPAAAGVVGQLSTRRERDESQPVSGTHLHMPILGDRENETLSSQLRQAAGQEV